MGSDHHSVLLLCTHLWVHSGFTLLFPAVFSSPCPPHLTYLRNTDIGTPAWPESPTGSPGLVLSCVRHVGLLAALWTVAYQAPLSMRFSRQEYWNGQPCQGLLQEIFLTQRSNRGLLCLLHWQADSFPLSHQESHLNPHHLLLKSATDLLSTPFIPISWNFFFF